jgi:transposase
MTTNSTKSEGSHVVSIMLHPEKWQRDKLETRFHMAKQAYNRALDEWLKRRRKYHQHPVFRDAMDLECEKKRRQAFRHAMEDVGFVRTYSQSISASDKNELFDGTDIAHHLSSEILRRVCGFAVDAVWNWHDKHTKGKPSFKFEPPPLVGNRSIRLDGTNIRVGGVRGGANAMILPLSPKQLSHEKIQRSLSRMAKYPTIMLVRKKIRGSVEYEAKITCEGHAPISQDTQVSGGVVGVDVGPQRIAAVGDSSAIETPILNDAFYSDHLRNLRVLQRKRDRQWRANNPEYYDDKGRIKPGPKDWTISKGMEQTMDAEREVHRVIEEDRKRQHYELCKRLLSMGNKFVVEDNCYSGWQSGLFGKSVSKAAPSAFIDRLEEKATSAGGWLRRVSTWDTYLSSRCHCGKRTKKKLSQRMHRCKCGVTAQRDLYSAFLARYVDGEGNLDAARASREWVLLEPAIQSASRESESARDETCEPSFHVEDPERAEQIDWIPDVEHGGGLR